MLACLREHVVIMNPERILIDSILSRKEELQWIIDQSVQAEKVVNFGCNAGEQTLALAWVVGAHEVIGLDIEESNIQDAQVNTERIKEALTSLHRSLCYHPESISEDDKNWWDIRAPRFFKEDLREGRIRIDFSVQDITKPIELSSNYYDLAFCDFVLYQIFSSNESENAYDYTKFTVHEMARVIRANGIVAVREPVQMTDGRSMDLRHLFAEVGLRLIHSEESDSSIGTVGKYLCKKPSAG